MTINWKGWLCHPTACIACSAAQLLLRNLLLRNCYATVVAAEGVMQLRKPAQPGRCADHDMCLGDEYTYAWQAVTKYVQDKRMAGSNSTQAQDAALVCVLADLNAVKVQMFEALST